MIDQRSVKQVGELRECMIRNVMRLMSEGKLLVAIHFDRFAERECKKMTLMLNDFPLTDIAKIALEIAMAIDLLVKIAQDFLQGFCAAELVEH